jgi:hypothetical protein
MFAENKIIGSSVRCCVRNRGAVGDIDRFSVFEKFNLIDGTLGLQIFWWVAVSIIRKSVVGARLGALRAF